MQVLYGASMNKAEVFPLLVSAEGLWTAADTREDEELGPPLLLRQHVGLQQAAAAGGGAGRPGAAPRAAAGRASGGARPAGGGA